MDNIFTKIALFISLNLKISWFRVKKLWKILIKTFQNRIINTFLNFTHFIKTHYYAQNQPKEEVNTKFDEKSDNVAKQEKDVYELRSSDLVIKN